jgi:hypothetical protein
MNAPVTQYTNLITSEHADKSKFVATVTASVQGWADITALENQIPLLYDVDNAVGEQLDIIGQWVGVTRNLKLSIAGIYFAFDTANVGFDQGIWQGPYDPDTGLVQLPDTHYRILIKATILNNVWNGTTDHAYTLANSVFQIFGYSLFIEDPSNLTMNLGLVGQGAPDALTLALFTGGYLNIKPAGVHISSYFTQFTPGPLFAFDLNDGVKFSGFDLGTWAKVTAN